MSGDQRHASARQMLAERIAQRVHACGIERGERLVEHPQRT